MATPEPSCRPVIKGLSIRIPRIIPVKGRGFINHISTSLTLNPPSKCFGYQAEGQMGYSWE